MSTESQPSEPIDFDYCPNTKGKHSWRFDGDDPYIICSCGQVRDALNGRVLADPRKPDATDNTDSLSEPMCLCGYNPKTGYRTDIVCPVHDATDPREGTSERPVSYSEGGVKANETRQAIEQILYYEVRGWTDCDAMDRVDAIDKLETLIAARTVEARLKALEWVLIQTGRWTEDSDVGLIQMASNPLDRAIAEEILDLAASLEKGEKE